MQDVVPEELEGVLEFIHETPAVVAAAIAGVSDVDLRWKPAPDQFSIVENVCHMRDLEVEGYAVRIRRLLAEQRPFMPDFEGDRIAEERNYNEQSATAALQTFAQAREENLLAVKNLGVSELDRTGLLEKVGAISLRRLLQLMATHDRTHRHELTEIRAQLAARARND